MVDPKTSREVRIKSLHIACSRPQERKLLTNAKSADFHHKIILHNTTQYTSLVLTHELTYCPAAEAS